jgi:hypothetical protein
MRYQLGNVVIHFPQFLVTTIAMSFGVFVLRVLSVVAKTVPSPVRTITKIAVAFAGGFLWLRVAAQAKV